MDVRFWCVAVFAVVGCQEHNFKSLVDTADEEEEVATTPPDPTIPNTEPTTPATTPPAADEPVADAGPDRTVELDTPINLDGTGSYDPGGLEPLTYSWTLDSKPVGATGTLDDRTSPTPGIVLDAEGAWSFSLVVTNTDGIWDSTADVVVINSEYNAPPEPVADAGPDQTVTEGDVVTVDGTGSYDPSNLVPLVYEWSLVSRPSGSAAMMVDDTADVTTFTADVPGDFVFDLAVMNTAGVWDSTPDDIIIHVDEAPIVEPIADGGPDQTVQPLQSVFLDGSASYDPQGLTPLAYSWSIVAAPAGSGVSLNNRTTVSPSFYADLAGMYELDLTVQNTAGLWDTTPDKVFITAEPADGFYVQLSWDAGNDLDLHVMEGGGLIFDKPGDCNFCNDNPNWGGAGGADDPSLDADAINGYGPETITIDAPAAGSYDVKVHYYGEDGDDRCTGACATTEATLAVYLGGVLADTFTHTLDSDNQVWDAVTIDWPSGLITFTDGQSTTTRINCF